MTVRIMAGKKRPAPAGHRQQTAPDCAMVERKRQRRELVQRLMVAAQACANVRDAPAQYGVGYPQQMSYLRTVVSGQHQ